MNKYINTLFCVPFTKIKYIRSEGRAKSGKYKTAPAKLENNVWIAANMVILRGTEVDDNCAVRDEYIVKTKNEVDSVIIQKCFAKIFEGKYGEEVFSLAFQFV